MINNTKKEKVVVFGYSDNPDRYSYMAYQLLKEFDHEAIAFNPRVQTIEDIPSEFDTATLYMSEAISNKFEKLFLDSHFKRIIINPGAENSALEEKLKSRGVEVIRGCTLVMLKTHQF